MPTSRGAVEDFLYMEARLLDSRQFEEWMDLFTDDAVYWVPAGHDDIDPSRHVSIIHDDKAQMAVRVKRLRSGFAFAQDPASRVHRLISNIRILSEDEDALEVTCMMLLVELARKKQTIHTAYCEFSLLTGRTPWSIRRKKVNLLRNGEVLESTPFLI
jgi:3-phenylpropionate/cinnamic acid dioxygenase small subunit